MLYYVFTDEYKIIGIDAVQGLGSKIGKNEVNIRQIL
jgi:hypothetical protein